MRRFDPPADGPPLLVPSLLWGGGSGCSLFKVPYHTFGSAKRRYLRLKPYVGTTGDGNRSPWVEVALVDNAQKTLADSSTRNKYCVVKAWDPLVLVWDEPHHSTMGNSPLLSSPFKNRGSDDDRHQILLRDIAKVAGGNRTAAFQAYIAKNGNWSLPNEACCFSLISERRSVDFYVSSPEGGGNADGRDVKLANAWKDSIRTLLDNYHQKQRQQSGSVAPMVRMTSHRWDPTKHSKSLFEAARCGDIGTLRWFFDHGCPIDFMDDRTGDTVLLVACRLGHLDVANCALLEYHARNDPHPDFGRTALQTAVSAGHVGIVRLILDTAEASGADITISNHVDDNGEAPVHIAARCGSKKIMELLVTHGANLGLVDGAGRTCLHCSAQAGQASCLTYALDLGAEGYLEVLSHDGFTPLHLAVRANKMDCVKVLLQAGADVSTETGGGSNVYNLASSKQRSESIVKLLLEYDVSEGESYYDSSCDEDGGGDSSEENMFQGLNTYTVSPSKQAPLSHQSSVSNRSPFGSLVSPVAPAHPHHRPKPGVNMPSPIVGPKSTGSEVAFCSGGNRVRFDMGEDSVGYLPRQNYVEGEEFDYGGESWKIFTHEGYPYYYNSIQDRSSWEDPRAIGSCASTPHHHSFHEVPVSPMREGLNHERHRQGARSFKLTAIPQPCIAAPMTPLPDAPGSISSAGTNQEVAEASQELSGGDSAVAPQHQLSSNTNAKSSRLGPSRIPTLALQAAKIEAGVEESKLLAQKSHCSAESKFPTDMDNPKLPSLSGALPSTKQEKVDHKSMLLDQIKSRTLHTSGDIGQSAMPAEAIAKYEKMILVGVPVPSVCHKMRRDGMSENNIDSMKAFSKRGAPCNISEHESSKANIQTESSFSSSKSPKKQNKDQIKAILTQDESTKKFMRMVSVGVPVKAVAHKMKQEGTSSEKIDIFNEFHGLVTALPLPAPQTTPVASSGVRVAASVSEKDLAKDSAFAKYIRMKTVGVPLMAIVAKMSQDGVSEDKIHLFSVAFGIRSSNMASPKPPMPPIPRERRRASKAMQKIHWTTVADEKLRGSLWVSDDADDEIKDNEIEQLESLFSASPIKNSFSGKRNAAKNKSFQKSSLIDPKRANNIAIALAQFRCFANFDDLCQAVDRLDREHLDLEKLQNMKLLLPRADELNSLKKLNGQCDGLGRAELFFLSVMKIPQFPQKLAAFEFTLQFDESCSSLASSLELLQKACDEVMKSVKLGSILRRLLAIGNLMNESSGKPQARGITLDSLIKTAKKKGSDGKTSVLDLLVTTAMNNKSKIAEFWADMPTVREAMRHDLDDFRLSLKEIQTGVQSVQHTTAEIKKYNATSHDDGPSSTNILHKLEPFLEQATVKLEETADLFSQVEGRVQSLCSFFAEDFKTCKTSTIFGVLFNFSRLVEKSKDMHIRKSRQR